VAARSFEEIRSWKTIETHLNGTTYHISWFLLFRNGKPPWVSELGTPSLTGTFVER